MSVLCCPQPRSYSTVAHPGGMLNSVQDTTAKSEIGDQTWGCSFNLARPTLLSESRYLKCNQRWLQVHAMTSCLKTWGFYLLPAQCRHQSPCLRA